MAYEKHCGHCDRECNPEDLDDDGELFEGWLCRTCSDAPKCSECFHHTWGHAPDCFWYDDGEDDQDSLMEEQRERTWGWDK